MNKLTEQKHCGKRILFRILAAAAIIGAMTLTVFAGGDAAHWFRDLFSRNRGEELSDGQVEFIESNAVLLDQSQTVNGYTVTLDSYLSDGSSVYVKTIIQAPEGKEIAAQGFKFGEIDVLQENDEVAGCFLSWDLVERSEDMTFATYMLTFDFVVLEGFDGDTNVISIELADLYDGPKPIGGSWQFAFELTDASIELLTGPVGGVQARSLGGQPFEVTVTSAHLRPMGLRLLYEIPASERDYQHHQFAAATAVMLDGTTVELLSSGCGRQSDGDSEILWVEYYGGIIVPDEIAYIELPGGVQIPVNAE